MLGKGRTYYNTAGQALVQGLLLLLLPGLLLDLAVVHGEQVIIQEGLLALLRGESIEQLRAADAHGRVWRWGWVLHPARVEAVKAQHNTLRSAN